MGKINLKPFELVYGWELIDLYNQANKKLFSFSKDYFLAPPKRLYVLTEIDYDCQLNEDPNKYYFLVIYQLLYLFHNDWVRITGGFTR